MNSLREQQRHNSQQQADADQRHGGPGLAETKPHQPVMEMILDI